MWELAATQELVQALAAERMVSTQGLGRAQVLVQSGLRREQKLGGCRSAGWASEFGEAGWQRQEGW